LRDERRRQDNVEDKESTSGYNAGKYQPIRVIWRSIDMRCYGKTCGAEKKEAGKLAEGNG